MERLIVLGCRRSGTTLLASLIGAHSQVNMLNDDYGDAVTRLIGKKYQGVKLCYPHIQYDSRRHSFYRWLYHKLVKIRRVLRGLTIYWDMQMGCRYSIKDYIKQDCKFIIISRTKDGNTWSMVQRSKISHKQANKEWTQFQEIKGKIPNYIHTTMDLITSDTESQLRKICDYLDIEYEPHMLNAAGLNNTYQREKIEHNS